MFEGLDMNALMEQAQKLQADMLKAQQEQAAKSFEGNAGGGLVKVTVSGAGELTDVQIKPEAYAGNTRLTELVASLRSQTRLFGLSSLREQGHLVSSAREHDAMLDAIEAGDAALARQLVHAHIEHVLTDWAGEAVEEQPGAASTS